MDMPFDIPMPSTWKTGLFDCSDDTNICLQGLFCPCFLFGKNVKRTRGPVTMCCPCTCYAYSMICCSCYYYHKNQRLHLRAYYGLPPGCGDCLTACFCGPCALCQEARELNLRANEPRELIIRQQPRY